jgi:hypothetical protein
MTFQADITNLAANRQGHPCIVPHDCPDESLRQYFSQRIISALARSIGKAGPMHPPHRVQAGGYS